VTTRAADRTLVGDQVFVAKVKATDNRVGAIVQAYDQANSQALAQIVAWVSAAGAELPQT
jgi:cholesterol transport system auxiliary component